MYGRNHHNTIKKLSFNSKLKEDFLKTSLYFLKNYTSSFCYLVKQETGLIRETAYFLTFQVWGEKKDKKRLWQEIFYKLVITNQDLIVFRTKHSRLEGNGESPRDSEQPLDTAKS